MFVCAALPGLTPSLPRVRSHTLCTGVLVCCVGACVRTCVQDALANLSVEKGPGGLISGHIRIRSKTQGIALSLGDKITLNQKVVA